MTASLPRPDLSDRPHGLTVERTMSAPPSAAYEAWTQRFDSWFASPGMMRMRAEVDEPFFFAVVHEGQVHPHYGRFLALEPDRLVELTWVTGRLGTGGAETVVRVELRPAGTGTDLRLTHTGFHEAADAERHRAWEGILATLDHQLSS